MRFGDTHRKMRPEAKHVLNI